MMEEINNLNIYITEEDFELDNVNSSNLSEKATSLFSLYQKDKFEFLVELAFVKEQELSISLSFLQYIARTFLQTIANNPQFNFSSIPFDCEIDNSTISKIIDSVPYIIGLEFVNQDWVLSILAKFNIAYKAVVENSHKTPLEYILSKGNPFVIPSRIYFHLVENKGSDNFPFAFLATYTAIDDGKLIHCPLKNALTQLKSDKNKLSALVSSITEATKESVLIKRFVESGNIFYPSKLSEYEAYIFLKEVPLYEQCGIVGRIPKWYTESISKVQVDIDENRQLESEDYTMRNLLDELGLSAQTDVAKQNGELTIEDSVIEDGDEIKLVQIIYGG
jgi:non-specific serine/threonine protein kinase